MLEMGPPETQDDPSQGSSSDTEAREPKIGGCYTERLRAAGRVDQTLSVVRAVAREPCARQTQNSLIPRLIRNTSAA